MNNIPILIVGGGAAGMAAALAAARRLTELRPGRLPEDYITLLERDTEPGGVLKQCVHHGFGLTRFSSDLTGIEYMHHFTEPFFKSGIRYLPDTSALKVFSDKTLSVSGPHTGRARLSFDHLILASGCYERAFQSLTTAGTRPSGIYTAGEAQYLINCCHKSIGERVVILGSGDMGQILARQLVLEGKKVLAVIEKNPFCGGLKKNQQECLEKNQIPLLLSSTILSVQGEGRITGVTIQNVQTKENTFISCDALISATGLIPERRILNEIRREKNLPEWISLCGNCHHVHKIVDSVTLQAEETGKKVVEKVFGF